MARMDLLPACCMSLDTCLHNDCFISFYVEGMFAKQRLPGVMGLRADVDGYKVTFPTDVHVVSVQMCSTSFALAL